MHLVFMVGFVIWLFMVGLVVLLGVVCFVVVGLLLAPVGGLLLGVWSSCVVVLVVCCGVGLVVGFGCGLIVVCVSYCDCVVAWFDYCRFGWVDGYLVWLLWWFLGGLFRLFVGLLTALLPWVCVTFVFDWDWMLMGLLRVLCLCLRLFGLLCLGLTWFCDYLWVWFWCCIWWLLCAIVLVLDLFDLRLALN